MRGATLADDCTSVSSSHAAGLRLLLLALPELVSGRALFEQSLQLALRFRRPIYDCVYVALSLREGCSLVTADRELVRQLGPAIGHILALEEVAPG